MSAIVGGVFIICCLMGLWDIAYEGYRSIRGHWRKS